LVVTLIALGRRDDLLAVRFAWSPAWETLGALRTLVDDRSRVHHRPWLRAVEERTKRLDLEPLLALQPLQGFVPDFLSPPPRTARPRLRDQLAEIRATAPGQVEHELRRCRETVVDERHREVIDRMLADPASARDLLAGRLRDAWVALVSPFWVRIRTLLDRDIEERARTLARHGLRRMLGELHPKIRWTTRGLSCRDGSGTPVKIDERGLVLLPSAYLWPHVAVVADEPWLPTIAYPARGVAELWSAPSSPPDALARVLGRTRALVLATLDRPLSTTALAAALELSPAGASRHLLALRDSGIVSAARHGQEVRYSRTALGSALLRGSGTPGA
jgi:DNA-binding transcriptional ArsR family regulator